MLEVDNRAAFLSWLPYHIAEGGIVWGDPLAPDLPFYRRVSPQWKQSEAIDWKAYFRVRRNADLISSCNCSLCDQNLKSMRFSPGIFVIIV